MAASSWFIGNATLHTDLSVHLHKWRYKARSRKKTNKLENCENNVISKACLTR